MNAPVEERLHALDAVRAGALLLGIVLHATMSFFLPIPARDASQSTTLAIAFFVIHVFRMSLFFLIAGFFARLLLARRGLRGFVVDRARRIALPLSVGWLLIAPPTIAILVIGVSRTFPDAAAAPPAPAAQGFPLTHLWFLYYLGLCYLGALALRSVARRWSDHGTIAVRLDDAFAFAVRARALPLLLAAPLALVLLADPAWPLWFGIPTPDTGLLPQLPALVGFGGAFACGWWLHRRADLLAVLRAHWRGHLALAIALTLAALALVGPLPASDTSTIAGPAHARPLYAVVYCASIGYWLLGLIGAALRYFAEASAWRRYLADASYWCYLVHLPIVFGLQVLMMDWPLHWSLKFALILTLTLAAVLASYQVMVRSTLIGEILNGRRHLRAPRAGSDAPRVASAATLHAGSAVARFSAVSKRYGDALALDRLDLEIAPGEVLALLGPNGAGKSTAIGLWLGTLAADAGAVDLLGGAPTAVQSRLGIGVMMQDVALAPTLSARELITLTASYYRDPLSVDECIAQAGIAAFADQRQSRLSGGQKRQVQFALAICGRPQLLFLDEPTVALDLQARAAMWRAIRALRAAGCAIVLTTHHLEEAEALADRVVVLAKGRVIAEGSVEAMRALVGCRRIRCHSTLDPAQLRTWPGVVDAGRDGKLVQLTAVDAEAVVRRLLASDPDLGQLEVQQASLAEAFTELTREAA
jgi:ABC-type multidrug transport system ATPase subunit/fucose 4-O-acetylase-like acetyltransferase